MCTLFRDRKIRQLVSCHNSIHSAPKRRMNRMNESALFCINSDCCYSGELSKQCEHCFLSNAFLLQQLRSFTELLFPVLCYSKPGVTATGKVPKIALLYLTISRIALMICSFFCLMRNSIFLNWSISDSETSTNLAALLKTASFQCYNHRAVIIAG